MVTCCMYLLKNWRIVFGFEMIMLFKETLEDLEFEDDDVHAVIADLDSRAPYIIQEEPEATA